MLQSFVVIMFCATWLFSEEDCTSTQFVLQVLAMDLIQVEGKMN